MFHVSDKQGSILSYCHHPQNVRDARGIVSAGFRLCRLEEIGATMAIRLALSDRTLVEEAV
jgi:hypothetical protein